MWAVFLVLFQQSQLVNKNSFEDFELLRGVVLFLVQVDTFWQPTRRICEHLFHIYITDNITCGFLESFITVIYVHRIQRSRIYLLISRILSNDAELDDEISTPL